MLKDNSEGRMYCPRCNSDAVYRYGHIRSGKQRYLCLLCGRQFVVSLRRVDDPERPFCPRCHNRMYLYQRGAQFVRFRCRNYPACRQYRKISLSSGPNAVNNADKESQCPSHTVDDDFILKKSFPLQVRFLQEKVSPKKG
jgi:DNA-directed RNA polymerase subunit RPC12/RpoP